MSLENATALNRFKLRFITHYGLFQLEPEKLVFVAARGDIRFYRFPS